MFNVPASAQQGVVAGLKKIGLTDADRRKRCERYDNTVPELKVDPLKTNVLIFTKINGFDHGPSVTAATDAIKGLADHLGWTVSVSNKGGTFNRETLAQFDVVVWNDNSGDVLTLSQRKAFEDYIHQGGGFVGIHGAGGDSSVYWDWYVDTLIGANFIGHPMEPQFQTANLAVEKTNNGIAHQLQPGWSMKDEWYSFAKSSRKQGTEIIVTLDENSYLPEGFGGQDLRMGKDHPIVWNRCVQSGRAFYTAIGHRPEVYFVPENLILLRDALVWASGKGGSSC